MPIDAPVVGVAEPLGDAPGAEVVVVPVPHRLPGPGEGHPETRPEREDEQYGAEERLSARPRRGFRIRGHAGSLPRVVISSRIRRK